MVAVEGNHGAAVELGVPEFCRCTRFSRVGPSREYVSETDDLILAVGGDGIAGAVQLEAPVRIHLLQSDGEQLQNFAGKVFIGIDSVARLVVIHHVQIVPHHGAQGNVRQQR